MSLRRLHPLSRSTLCVVALALTACGSSHDAAEGGDDQDDSALSLFDPTTPDENNIWMKGVDPSSLAIGEEVVLPDEETQFTQMVETIHGMQDYFATKTGAVGRTFHQKMHGCVLGEMHVKAPDVPELRVGLFAHDGVYPTWVRLSNGVGFTQKDKSADARGLALKVMKVPGKKLLGGREDALTQDFLAINSSIQPAPDVAQFVAFGAAMVDAQKQGDDPSLALPGGITAKFPGIDFGPLKRMFAQGGYLLRPENKRLRGVLLGKLLPRTLLGGSVFGEEYFSGAPIAMGVTPGAPMTARAAQAAKYRMVTGVIDNGACTPVRRLPEFSDPSYMKTDLIQRLRQGSACVDLQMQLQKDPAKQIIEDSTVEWKASDSPYVSVAMVVLPQTDLESPAAREKEQFCTTLGFTPWHTLPEHRPLGNMMRARRRIYEASREHRGGIGEPTGDEFPVDAR